MEILTKKRLAGLILAVLLITALALAARHSLSTVAPQQPVEITAVPVSQINKPIKVMRTGTVENSTHVPVSADFSGELSEVYVAAGQAVKAGQPLFKIQASSVPEVSQPATAAPQSHDNYDKALEEYNRNQKLYEIGAIPRRQLEAAAARLQQAQESSSPVQDNIPSSGPAINSTTIVKAPIDGIVTSLSAAAGKAVQAGQQLLALGSGQEVEIVAQLNQNDLYLVHLGTAAAIDMPNNQPVTGQVSQIYPRIEANQPPSFLAHLKLSGNPDNLLKPGMTANVYIDIGKSAAVPAVPSTSIFIDEQGQSFIYVVANDKAKRQQVTIGEIISDFTEITSPLPPQALVITSPISELKDGTAVTIVQ